MSWSEHLAIGGASIAGIVLVAVLARLWLLGRRRLRHVQTARQARPNANVWAWRAEAAAKYAEAQRAERQEIYRMANSLIQFDDLKPQVVYFMLLLAGHTPDFIRGTTHLFDKRDGAR